MNRVTTTALAALKMGHDNGERVIDGGGRGEGALLLRVTDTGRLFYLRYFHAGKRKLELIGHFDPKGAEAWRMGDTCHKGGSLSLKAAREGFRELSLLAKSVGDLKPHFAAEQAKRDEARRQAELEARAGTFGDLLKVYVEHLRAREAPSTREVEATFARNVRDPFPALILQRANSIRPSDIQAILARMVKRGTTRYVNLTRTYLRAAFRYAGGAHDFDPRRLAHEEKVFDLQGNPVELVPRIREFDRMGERWLSGPEIRRYFQLLDTVRNPIVSAFLRFHLLTGGQRPRQLLAATWKHYDEAAGTVTLTDRKGRAKPREHLVPLLPEALAILAAIRPITGEFGHPFTTNGRVPLWLETLGAAVREIARDFETPFTLRDVRRTVETQLAAKGVSREVRAQLLSHGRGDKIAQTYDKYDYLNEKRRALRVWCDFLDGTNSAVVTRKFARRR